MTAILSIKDLSKTYKGGHQALKSIDLDIKRGEIFALLGPNGAGKTTLIGIICGLVRKTSGTVTVDSKDIATDYRAVRARIGLVPQEMSVNIFDRVLDTVAFSRGLFGKPKDPALIEKLLRDLMLWEKRHEKIRALSGGMKRRVLIAKALAHEPEILFLDEPSAGVDVELRREMWDMVRTLRESGVTIILTTHYIEEAEEMADRVGVINKGELILVDEKKALMRKLGTTTISVTLAEPMPALPPPLEDMKIQRSDDGRCLTYIVHGEGDNVGLAEIVRTLDALGIAFTAINAEQSSLEDIFVDLVENGR